jgi:RNA polymerase sigma factor (sigma-70 family)
VTALLDTPPALATITDTDSAEFTDYGCRAFTRQDEDAMIARCLTRCRAMAWKQFQRMPPSAVDLDELVSIAQIGLVQAARKYADYAMRRGFDPHAAGGTFQDAYAIRRMQGAILDYLRSQDHVSRGTRHTLKGLAEGMSLAELGITKEAAEKARARDVHPVSLETQAVDGYDPADTEAGPESQVVVSEVQRAALAAYDGLDGWTQAIVAMRFHQGLDMYEVAERMACWGLTFADVQAAADAGAVAIHRAMLLAASDGSM